MHASITNDMDKPFSNRELNEMFKAADQRADTFHQSLMQRMDVFESNTSTTLAEIRVQTKLTNGRVTAAERWQYVFTGGLSVLTLIVVPLLAWALYTLAGIQNTVNTSVNQALSAYDIKVK